jgi:hypothetical protein
MVELLVIIGIYIIGFIVTPLVFALIDKNCLEKDGSFNWGDFGVLVVVWPLLLVVGIVFIPFALIARSVDSILKWIKGDKP